ncbi:MAG: nucleoside hydrolase [Erysipelotrichaceae bacterium]|nr:nucleoside hydrolase [Erysipelotrichaceae bacterium]
MKKVIINCGKGTTDTSFIPLLHHVDVVAITCTEENYELYKDCGYPVYVGTSKAIMEPRTAEPVKVLTETKAWDVMLHTEDYEIVSLGAMTNIAIALVRKPELKETIRRIVMVGGSAKSGDVTPFAEKSVYDDPFAADIVLQSGIDITMLGLDVTKNQTRSKEMLGVIAMLDDKWYTSTHMFVGVETYSSKTMGLTVCDVFGKEHREPNCHVVTAIDADKIHCGRTGGH